MTTLSGVLEKLRIRKQDDEFLVAEEGFDDPSGKLYTPAILPLLKPIVLRATPILPALRSYI
jgi:hypothetical protein